MADSQHICAVAGCHKPKVTRGFCNSHYLRLKRHGAPLGGATPKGEPLRWARRLAANPPEGCVEWPFATNGNGYGWAWYQGARIGAHRLLLVLRTGQNPKDKDAAHGPCHNRACVNPNHLSWSTRLANVRDQKRDGHKGHILCASDAKEIRNSSAPVSELSQRYGVCISTIYKIKQGRAWADAK